MDPNFPTPSGMGGAAPDVSAGMAPPAAAPQMPTPTPAPSPQDAALSHDTLFGRAAKMLMGGTTTYNVDQNGNTVAVQSPNTFQSFAKNVLAASLLGAAAGANGNPAQGFAGGFARGGAASVGNQERQDLIKRQQAEQQFKDQQAADAADREKTLTHAQVANMTSLIADRQRTSDLHDQEQHDKHNAASAALLSTLTAAGGKPAMIALPDGAKSDFTAPELAAAYTKDPSILKSPDGFVRHFLDTSDSSELTYNGHNWVDASGNPVNMTDRTTVKAIDVPMDAMKTKIPTSGKDVNAAYGGKLVDPDKTYQMSPLEMDALNTKRMSTNKQQADINAKNKEASQKDAELGLKRQELGLKSRELKLKEAQSGVDPNGQPSSLARDIASGHVTPERLGYLLSKNPDLINEVMRVDPSFDSAKAQSYLSVYKDFTSSKPNTAGGTLIAASTAFKHLKELQALNTPASRIPGTADYQRYENKVDTVAPELAKVYNDSTIPGIASYKKTLNALFNRDAAIQTQAQSMGDKVDSLAQTWKNAAPSSVYQAKMPYIDDEAINARAALDPKYKARIDNGQHEDQAARQPGGPPPGATMKVPGSDGKMYWSDGHTNLGVVQ